jgi:hypothetical protein
MFDVVLRFLDVSVFQFLGFKVDKRTTMIIDSTKRHTGEQKLLPSYAGKKLRKKGKTSKRSFFLLHSKKCAYQKATKKAIQQSYSRGYIRGYSGDAVSTVFFSTEILTKFLYALRRNYDEKEQIRRPRKKGPIFICPNHLGIRNPP